MCARLDYIRNIEYSTTIISHLTMFPPSDHFKAKKSRIRETKHLSTDVDSSTDTKKYKKKIFFFKTNHATSSNLYRSYYPHQSRKLVSPVCGIFFNGVNFCWGVGGSNKFQKNKNKIWDPHPQKNNCVLNFFYPY